MEFDLATDRQTGKDLLLCTEPTLTQKAFVLEIQKVELKLAEDGGNRQGLIDAAVGLLNVAQLAYSFSEIPLAVYALVRGAEIMQAPQILLIDRISPLKLGLLRERWESVHLPPSNSFEAQFLEVCHMYPLESIIILLGLAKGDFRLEQTDFVWELIYGHVDEIIALGEPMGTYLRLRIQNRFRLQLHELKRMPK